jgi:NAD(P)-dependent dehydrogenase (short-subunit alcohol dehydrogenase family)
MTQRSPVVLITGTSSGIGRAIASAFAANGFEVFGTSRNPQRNEPIAGVELLPLDVSDQAAVASAVSTVIQRAGRIDVLVNNAGVGVFGAAEESSIAQAQELFDTNFFGLIRVTNEVLPHLRAQRSGRIINISSVLGFLPAPYGALYAASKHAVEGYSESLDHETRDFGVRVSLVEPGYTDTAFDANAADPDSPIESYRALREHVKERRRRPVGGGKGRVEGGDQPLAEVALPGWATGSSTDGAEKVRAGSVTGQGNSQGEQSHQNAEAESGAAKCQVVAEKQ